MGGRETLGTGYQAAMPEPFHSRGQHLCKCLGKKRKRLHKKRVSNRVGLEHQDGRVSLFWNTKMAACHCFGTPRWPRVIVLEHQYGRNDVM